MHHRRTIAAGHAGNGAEAELWVAGRSGSVDASLMSADELAEYEDKKLKLRKVWHERTALNGGRMEWRAVLLENDMHSSAASGQAGRIHLPNRVCLLGQPASAWRTGPGRICWTSSSSAAPLPVYCAGHG